MRRENRSVARAESRWHPAKNFKNTSGGGRSQRNAEKPSVTILRLAAGVPPFQCAEAAAPSRSPVGLALVEKQVAVTDSNASPSTHSGSSNLQRSPPCRLMPAA